MEELERTVIVHETRISATEFNVTGRTMIITLKKSCHIIEFKICKLYLFIILDLTEMIADQEIQLTAVEENIQGNGRNCLQQNNNKWCHWKTEGHLMQPTKQKFFINFLVKITFCF